MFIHWDNKLRVPLNAVQVKRPPALVSLRFRYLRTSSCMTETHRCPLSSARSTQKFGGKKKIKNMKRRKQGNSDYDPFPSHELQVAFWNIVTLHTLK